MRPFLLIVLPRLFGAATLLSAVLGALNLAFGWSLAVKIGGSTIDPPEDAVGLVVIAVLGGLSFAFAEAVERDLVGELRRRGPKAWAAVALAVVGLAVLVPTALERMFHGSRAEWAAATGRVEALGEELAGSGDRKALATRLLRSAAISDQVEATRLLLEAGADPNAREPEGLPVLGRAVLQGAERVTGLLLERGADPNGPDAHGSTPLHVAAGYGNLDDEQRLRLVEMLLARGADPTRRNRFDIDPRKLATQAGNPRVAERLARR